MKHNLNEKLNIPVNWNKVIKYSMWIIWSLFVIAIVLKIRTILVVAELLGALLIFGLIFGGVYALINKYSSNKGKENE